MSRTARTASPALGHRGAEPGRRPDRTTRAGRHWQAGVLRGRRRVGRHRSVAVSHRCGLRGRSPTMRPAVCRDLSLRQAADDDDVVGRRRRGSTRSRVGDEMWLDDGSFRRHPHVGEPVGHEVRRRDEPRDGCVEHTAGAVITISVAWSADSTREPREHPCRTPASGVRPTHAVQTAPSRNRSVPRHPSRKLCSVITTGTPVAPAAATADDESANHVLWT